MMQKISPWFETTPEQHRYPALQRSVKTDVAVVGGGITGVTTAWCLAERGMNVVLLEKNTIASGDTGYTTSFLSRVPDTAISSVVERYGKEALAKVFAATTEAMNFLTNLIQDEQISCDFVSCSSFISSYREHDHFLSSEWSSIESTEVKFSRVHRRTDLSLPTPIVEAIRFDNEGSFDPRKFLFGLLTGSTGKRLNVFEHSGVVKIEDRENMVIHTKNGQVQAKKVVIATGAPPAFFPELSGTIKPMVTYALRAEYPGGAPIPNHLFWDTDCPYQYYRRMDDKSIILGGADRDLGVKPPPDVAKPHDVLKRFLRDRFGDPFTVSHQWSGGLYETKDGLPIIGPVPDKENIFIASGFSGNGMVMGTMAGMMLADLALGKINAKANLFAPDRLRYQRNFRE